VPSLPIKTQTFLANIPLFKEMQQEEIDRIAANTSEIHVVRGDVLFRKGDPCAGFHVVVYGQIKLAFTSPSGMEKVVEIIMPGQSFGEAIMFMETPYVVYAQALADSMLLHITKSAVFDELERDPKFARRMVAGLSRRLHGLISDLESYSLHSGSQRVIGFLLRSEPESDARGEQLSVELPTRKSIIASRLNLTPEHFSRILHDLAEDGLIKVEGRSIVILDIERLRTYEV
jgi:CRP-like cAMP-binding protein